MAGSLDLGFSSAASGATGGGNVQNNAPLFGDYSGTGGSSSGSDGASSAATASDKGPAATTLPTLTAAGTSTMSSPVFNWTLAAWIAGGVAALLGLIYLLRK